MTKSLATHPLFYLAIFLIILLSIVNLLVNSGQQFVYLADAFLKGSFSQAIKPENISDFAYFNGKYYWPLGPLPAVLIMPFLFIFKTFQQSYIQIPLNLLNFWLKSAIL